MEAVTPAGDRGRAVAVPGNREAANRRATARGDRRVEVDTGDATAGDDDVAQGGNDCTIRQYTDGTDDALQARGADQDVARRGQRGAHGGTGEASPLATGHGRPRSRRRDATDERGALQRDAAVRGRKGGAQSEGVFAGAAGVGGDDHVAAERRADRSSDRNTGRADGGIGSERDGARRAERGGGGGVQAVTVRTRRGDRQSARVHARAGRDRPG